MNTIQTFDIATLRMQLRSCGTEAFLGGRRMHGAAALLLNTLDEILNALALHQGEPDLVVAIPEKPVAAVPVPKYAAAPEPVVPQPAPTHPVIPAKYPPPESVL